MFWGFRVQFFVIKKKIKKNNNIIITITYQNIISWPRYFLRQSTNDLEITLQLPSC